MNKTKSISFRPDQESVKVLDSVQNKSAAINTALHLYSFGKLPDLQHLSKVLCRLQLNINELEDSKTTCEIKEIVKELWQCLRL